MNIFEVLEISAAVEDIGLYMTPVDTCGLFAYSGPLWPVGGQYSLLVSRDKCNEKGSCGCDGWRLPTIKKTVSLMGSEKGEVRFLCSSVLCP